MENNILIYLIQFLSQVPSNINNKVEFFDKVIELVKAILPSVVAIAVVYIGGRQGLRKDEIILDSKQNKELLKLKREEIKDLFLKLNTINTSTLVLNGYTDQLEIISNQKTIEDNKCEIVNIFYELMIHYEVESIMTPLFDTYNEENEKIDKLDISTKEKHNNYLEQYCKNNMSFIIDSCFKLKEIIIDDLRKNT